RDAPVAELENIDMRRRADDAVAQLALEPRHQRQRDEDGHDADHEADDRDERDLRDERLLAPREQVANGNEQLEGGVVHWGPLTIRRHVGAGVLKVPTCCSWWC